ncbi:MAG: hypothetical protein KDK64_06190 [Chlamydiia bacterium]|nr:hypothetical protein [Chlamydiia bacterium]
MSRDLVLSTTLGTQCQYRNKSFICDVEGERRSIPTIAQQVCTRPPQCDKDPVFAAKYAGSICQFRCDDGTSGCGCPELNNKRLWKAYEQTVLDAVGRQAVFKQEITVVFFASGALRNESRLIPLILKQLHDSGWQGTLNLHFVDPKYVVQRTERIRVQVQGKVSPEYMVVATTCGAVGLGALGYGCFSKGDSKVRSISVGGGILLIILAIYLGVQAQAQTTFEEKEVTRVELNEEATASIRGTLGRAKQYLGKGMTLHTEFFGSQADCSQSIDLLLGYDIGSFLGDFQKLQQAHLSLMGDAILAAKVGPPGQMGTPVLLTASGKEGLQQIVWQGQS